jgi:hypothetical protein
MAKPGNVQVAWPHDGMKQEPGSGTTIADMYRQQGVPLLPEKFTNPPAMGNKEGDIRIEPGIHAILQAMEEGRFKVFDDLHDWWEEFGMYYRGDNGKIVDRQDDLMSATRYAFQSLRFAQEPTTGFLSKYKDSIQQSWSHIV